MAVEKQYADGSYGGIRERDGLTTWRAGGMIGPAGSNSPGFFGGSILVFNVAGGTDTAGGIMSWQNNLGYDIVVTAHQIDITTQSSGACTASFGQTAVNGTTLASNMLSGGNMGAVALLNGGALSVKVPQNTWITGSTATGASAGLVARAYFQFQPSPAAGAA